MRIKCVRCGQIKMATRSRYQKLIEKFGSEEALKNNYLCRKCRKEVKAEKNKQQYDFKKNGNIEKQETEKQETEKIQEQGKPKSEAKKSRVKVWVKE